MIKKIFSNMRMVACILIAASGLFGLAADDAAIKCGVAGFMTALFIYLWVTRRKFFLVHYVGRGHEGSAYVSALGEMNIRVAEKALSEQFGRDITIVSFTRITRRQYKDYTNDKQKED